MDSSDQRRMMRPSGRAIDALRAVRLEVGIIKYPEGSCLVHFGDTRVLCTATVEQRVPHWVKDSGHGWVTAEYGMLPRSTAERVDREAARGRQTGRTQEIQRLIGRSLRAVTDLEKLKDIQIRIDCDVLQADGGTRTAAITGAFVALYQACQRLIDLGLLNVMPITDYVAAVSCGLHNGNAILDLDYAEDSAADADANFVLTGSGTIVEVQATAERRPFSETELLGLLALARSGIAQLVRVQRQALGVA
jgi:ribonuclease PH